MEGEAPSRRRLRSFSGFLGGYPWRLSRPRSTLGEAEDEEGEESVEMEESENTDVAASLEGSPEASDAPNLALSNKTFVFKADLNFLKIGEKMTQFMGKITQAVSLRDNSRAPAFKTP
ncbi:hypothetical protein O181_013923 [Austropuccinia psidii MF-1]|uniref:Uncharacterized protein n=1 Tax=Austropuccinia psidii MF-1 TaxID=1389203 RepID=A0A9Q3C089_9BASI|nr:hypothetical protein [Austropuccinia psidii MF-1]